MIKKIVLRDIASYDHNGVTFADLQKVNFIYGGNGTGKTTLSRVLENYKQKKEFSGCKIEWEGKPIEVLVYNQDFKRRNLKEEIPGVITLGGDMLRVVNERKRSRRRHRMSRLNPEEPMGAVDYPEFTEDGLRVVDSRDWEEAVDDDTYSVEPAMLNINRMLRWMGFSGFRVFTSRENPFSYRLVRNDGTNAGETLSEGEATIITFLYFMQLVYGGNKDDKDVEPKVVVIDDPICSLDSDVMFVVGEMIKQLLDGTRGRKERRWRMPELNMSLGPMNDIGLSVGWHERGVKQVFVLTHNVYFYKQVSERQRRADTHYWKLMKHGGVTSAKAFGQVNPVSSEYEMLWNEVRRLKNEGVCGIGIQNVMRRIIETYFVVMGGHNKRKLIPENFSDSREEMIIVNSLAKWADEGSHRIVEELYTGGNEELNEKYLRVFEKLFVKLGHEAHYNMMMREE